MNIFETTKYKAPKTSPWGQVQEQSILMWKQGPAPVMWMLHTAGHGGIKVHREIATKYLKELPKECFSFGGNKTLYEEDCEATVPLYIFFNKLDDACWFKKGGFPREKLMESIERYYPTSVDKIKEIAARVDAVASL